MDAKGKSEKELCQPPPPDNTNRVLTDAHMWMMKPLLSYDHVCFCVSNDMHVCVCTCGRQAAPAHSRCAHWSREKCAKMWTQRGREGRSGPISPLVTDSSMQTTSPQGRSQEAGPLTQAEEKGGGSEQQCKPWPYKKDLWRRSTSAGQTKIL